MREETLSTYPYPVIEVACRYCSRKGRYRRERLIREYGGGVALDRFVHMISSDCGYAEVRTGRRACNGPYIVSPQPPAKCPEDVRFDEGKEPAGMTTKCLRTVRLPGFEC